MEEVPASPELVKKRKSRRKGLLFKQRTSLSLNRGRPSEVQHQDSLIDDAPDVTEKEERFKETVVEPEPPPENNMLYFDVDTENIMLAFEDPLVSAVLLEKGNQVEHESTQPSNDFLANVKNRFVKVDEVIELKVEPTETVSAPSKLPIASTSKKANYSYTQFDLDTQMLGICEAADIIAGLNTNPEHELNDWSSPLKQQEIEEVAGRIKNEPKSQVLLEIPLREARRKDRWSNVRQSSFSRCSIVQRCQTPPSTSMDMKSFITVDFSDESDNELTVDFSKIKSSQLRKRLEKIQNYIDSPPQVVRRTSLRKTFSKKRPESSPRTPVVVRRLSYESTNSEQIDDIELQPIHVSSEGEEEMDCFDGTQKNYAPQEPAAVSSSPGGDNFDSSLLIKANIDQLSQFFLQSDNKPKSDSESLNKEPPFFGFPSHPTSPISLPSDPGGSPKILNIAWLFRNDSETESEEGLEVDSRPEENINCLLDDDDDLWEQIHPLQKSDKQIEAPSPESEQKIETLLTDVEFVKPLPKDSKAYHREPTEAVAGCNPALSSFEGFQSASGFRVQISEKALAKARDMWDDEDRKIDGDKVSSNTANYRACAGSILPLKEPSFGGFCTAGGSKVRISEEALAKAENMWKEDEKDYGFEVPHKTNTRNSDWSNPKTKADEQETAGQSFGGFQTAGGSRVQISEKALAKAQLIVHQIEDEMKTENALLDNRQDEFSGFQTARGSTVTVSDKALFKAESILRQVEFEVDHEFGAEAARGVNGLRTTCGESKKLETTKEKSNAMTLEVETELNNIPECQSAKRLRNEDGGETETPLKKFKLASSDEKFAKFSTSTPNIHCKAVPKQNQDGKHDLDHFFGDLDDHDFQRLFCGAEAIAASNRRIRPVKQVRLASRFEQCNEVSAEEHQISGGALWDDSFGDIVAKLNSDEGLKASEQIVEARKLARHRQQCYIESKPEADRKPRLNEFIRKKQMSRRKTLRQFMDNIQILPNSGDIQKDLPDVNADNAMDFKFDMVQLYGKAECLENADGVLLGDPGATTSLIFNDRCQVGFPELKSAFLASPGVDPALLPRGWIENSWVWILMKLTSMQRRFPDIFQSLTTPGNVFNQLMYRYHFEIDNAKRSVIRKMLEKDDVSSKRMVLFASRIFRGSDPFEVEIELCDGWYPIRTVLDFPLSKAVLDGKIAIGTKLMIQGAELMNLSEGCSPLEIPVDVRLKIHANSTRRTKWDTRLGLYKVPSSFVISCNTVLDRGGLVVCLNVMILRVYPLMFVDKTKRDALGSVLRSERVERRRAFENDSNRFENIQALFSQVQKEVNAEKVLTNGSSLIHKLTHATSTGELMELVKAGLDLSCIEIELSSTQRDAIMDYQRRKQEECLEEINRRVKERMSSQSSKRKVSSLLKLRIADARKPEEVLLLSIWRPPEDCDLFQEQKILEIINATANGTRNGEVQLTAGKNSSFRPLNIQRDEVPVQLLRTLTKIVDIEYSSFRPIFNEFDTIGIVVQVGLLENRKFQTVYLTDLRMNFLCVNFWSGIKEYAYEDVVKERAVLCISNLQWRTVNALNAVPTAFATEYTTFSEHSKSRHFVEEFQQVHATMKDLDLEVFFEKCNSKIAELNDRKLSRANSFSTPLRYASATTPMRSVLGSVNVNGPATPTDFSPGVGQPVSLQKRKLEQLAAYKSPPKLSPIIMRYNARVRKNFKIPAKLEDRIDQVEKDDSVC
ncbi:uncharacterized protein LOC134211095 isoform X2 [Armigeres subalbatus]|uniref:uncharacterized protein LOC134211095 isoform X2 n=1 Tax=Armigeres subalbatus TaxID=124917 RepID=UPI002ED0AA0D